MVKLSKVKDEKILKTTKEKKQVTEKSLSIYLTEEFSPET
jgi:hypothetical protein